jgi:MFS family permease
MRLHAVWTTNLTALLLGFGMYSSFILLPEFVELPASGGVGFGSSVTQAGIFLLPATLGMLVIGRLAGRLSSSVGAKVPLVAGCLLTAASYGSLAAAHDAGWEIYIAAAVMGVGIGFAFGAMANLIVAAVRPEETGVATGMNTIVRTIGGSLGSQISASVVVSATNAAFTTAFALSALVVAVSFFVSFSVPGLRRRTAPALVRSAS